MKNTLAGKHPSYEKRYNYVYQTKNKINGKTYIGVHCTNKLDDGYIGCGVNSQNNAKNRVKRGDNSPFVKAVFKYGYKNFKKEILNFFDTSEEAYEEEVYLVDKAWTSNKSNYNIALGGIKGIRFPNAYDYPKEVMEDYLNGMNIKSISSKYNLSLRAIRRATKSLRNSKTYYMNIRILKYKDKIHEIHEKYTLGTSRIKIQNEYNIPYETLKFFIDEFLWKINTDIKEYVAIKGDLKVVFDNIKIFSEQNKLFTSGIYQSLSGKISNYKGWRFYNKEDYDKGNYMVKLGRLDKHKGLKFINSSGDIEEVTTNLTDFCKVRGLQSSNIYQLWNGKMKQHKGYRLWQEIR